MTTQRGLGITKKLFIIALLVATVGSGIFGAPKVAAQTCDTTTTPPTTWGQVTQTINVTTAGTYRVWSRIKVPNTTANSYYFQVDNGCAINVGDSTSIPANTWTWVNYEKGATSNFADITLTAGTHTLEYTGKEADVQLDRVLLLTDLACVPTGVGDNCATADTTPPTTSITAPAGGTSVAVGTTVTINANAADASGIEKVEFLVDGVLKGTDTTSPYSYAWNTTGTAAGAHSLTTRAYDTAGNTTTSAAVSITLTGGGDTTSPTTAITAPAAGTSVAVGTNVTITASASDNVAVTKVEYYAGSTLLGSDTVEPYRQVWNTTGAAAGAYTITSKAFDAAGNTKISAGVGITLTGAADTTPPTTTLTAPASGTSVAVGATVNMSATAADNVGVTKVEFYRGTALLGTDTTGPSPYAFAWNTTGTALGTYTLTSKAFDAAGNVTSSAGVTITLTSGGDVTSPTVNLTAPVSGASYPIDAIVTMNANASDNVAVTKVEFYEGANLLGTDTTSAYSYAWSTTGKTVGTYSLTAKAYDAAGNTKTSTSVSISLTSSSTLPGDCSGPGGAGTTDGRVNALDLSVLLGKDGQAYPPCDFAVNGVIDAADLAILLSRWTW